MQDKGLRGHSCLPCRHSCRHLAGQKMRARVGITESSCLKSSCLIRSVSSPDSQVEIAGEELAKKGRDDHGWTYYNLAAGCVRRPPGCYAPMRDRGILNCRFGILLSSFWL